MTFEEIERLIGEAQGPVPDAWLSGLAEAAGERYDAYYRFLYRLVEYMRPALALEIGVMGGIASAHMAAAAKAYGGQVIGVDINQHPMLVRHIPERYGNYTFIHGDSTEAATLAQVCGLSARHGALGLVYQDSSHHYAASVMEWELYRPLVQAGGVWLCDDITPAFHDPKVDPPGLGMVQYFRERPGPKRLYPDMLHYGNVQGVILL